MAICRECWAEASLIAPAGKVLLIVPRKPGMVRPRSTVAGNAEGAGRSWHAALAKATRTAAAGSLASRTGHTGEGSPAPRLQNPGKGQRPANAPALRTPRSSRHREERSRATARRAYI